MRLLGTAGLLAVRPEFLAFLARTLAELRLLLPVRRWLLLVSTVGALLLGWLALFLEPLLGGLLLIATLGPLLVLLWLLAALEALLLCGLLPALLGPLRSHSALAVAHLLGLL